MANQASVELSFTERAKQFFNPSVIWQKIKEWKDTIFHILLFFCIGFLIGYFFKKYGQYVASFFVFIVLLVLLQQIGIMHISINWDKIQHLLGIQHVQITQGSTLLTLYWQWIKNNLGTVLGFSFGFLVGFGFSV